ncbi:MAG TPA: substrate-binding domain-containing protein [Planctomycetota bacterium]|nr:substrate-binding domain-containing protein [Planctomycetota bacterium]
MIGARTLTCTLALALAILAGACSDRSAARAGRNLRIGLIADSSSIPGPQATYAGALAAARELGTAHGVEVAIEWQVREAAGQGHAVVDLARGGARGILVAASEPERITAAIDEAAELGAAVVCIDSDVPGSRRFAFMGTDDEAWGRTLVGELSLALRRHGTIGVLAGDPTRARSQARMRGVLDELTRHPGLRLHPEGVIHHGESPGEAAGALARAHGALAEVDGWAMVGGWPLLAPGPLPWEPGAVKAVAVGALPEQLAHLEGGYVDVLLAEDCFGWGYRSVELLIDKLVDGFDPVGGPRLVDPPTRLTRADAEGFAALWRSWVKVP